MRRRNRACTSLWAENVDRGISVTLCPVFQIAFDSFFLVICSTIVIEMEVLAVDF